MQLLLGVALSLSVVATGPSGPLVPPPERFTPRAAPPLPNSDTASGRGGGMASSAAHLATQDAKGTPPAASAALSVHGVDGRPVELSMTVLRGLPRVTVTTTERGRTLTYEGVLVADVLKHAGLDSGHGHGQGLNQSVVATARDGYRVVFSMGEIDPNISASQIMIADALDGQPLADGVGPLRIVAPKDLHGSRGVRALVRLDVRNLEH